MLKSLFNDFLEDLAKDAIKLPKLHQYKAFN